MHCEIIAKRTLLFIDEFYSKINVYVLLSTLNGNVEGDVFKVDGEVVESVTTTSFGMYMDNIWSPKIW